MIDCPDCGGLGEWDEGPLPARSIVQIDPEYNRIICERCGGKGQLEKPDRCDDCGECAEDGETFDHVVEAFETYEKLICDGCFDNRNEAAWERQQEDNASEPPPTADERHQRAHDERQALRSGRPL